MTLTTESRGRPVAAAGTKTLPGIVASRVFEVITAATVVLQPAGVEGPGLDHQDWSAFRPLAPGGLPEISPVDAATVDHQSSLARRCRPALTAAELDSSAPAVCSASSIWRVSEWLVSSSR